MKKTIWLFLLLCSCGGIDFAGHSFKVNECNFRVQYGFTVRWNNLPIPIYVHQSVPPDARENLTYAVDMWNEAWNYHSGHGPLFEVMGDVNQLMPDQSGDGVNVFFIDRQKIFYPSPVNQNSQVHFLNNQRHGMTRLKTNLGGVLFDGDIIINNVAFDYHYENNMKNYSQYTNVPALSTARNLASTSSTPPSFWMSWLFAFQSFIGWLKDIWKHTIHRAPSTKPVTIPKHKVDSISLFLHELGHFGGLMHDEFDQSNVMFPKLGRGQVRRFLTEKDMQRMLCGYQK